MTFIYPHDAYTYRISLECWGQRADFYSLKLEETGEDMFKQLNPILPVKEILKEINGLADEMAV